MLLFNTQFIYQKVDLYAWYVTDTVNARISSQLQISARFELMSPLRLKICNKHPPPSSNKQTPSPEKKWVSVLSTIYETYTVYTILLMKCDIVKNVQGNVKQTCVTLKGHYVYTILCCSLLLNRNKDSVILRLKIDKWNKHPPSN